MRQESSQVNRSIWSYRAQKPLWSAKRDYCALLKLLATALLWGVSNVASAQAVELNLAGATNQDSQPTISAGVAVRTGNTLAGFALKNRFMVDMGSYTSLDFSALVDVPIDVGSGQFAVYGGFGADLTLAKEVRFRPSITAGIALLVDPQASLFTEFVYLWQTVYRIHAGVTFSF